MLGEGLLHKAAEHSPAPRLTSRAGCAVTPSPGLGWVMAHSCSLPGDAALQRARLSGAEVQIWECCLSNADLGGQSQHWSGRRAGKEKERSMVLHLAPEASAESAGSSQEKVLFFMIKTIIIGAGTRVNHKCHPNPIPRVLMKYKMKHAYLPPPSNVFLELDFIFLQTEAALKDRGSNSHILFSLQENPLFKLENVHLIGYSLGAHVAGFAGNHVHGTIGRITGLDPAGPMFEGVDPSRRLSPDDANFVDVLHTYTRETLGVSIGIQMPVGHIDIYPNGGDFQPGCGLSDVLGAIAYGTIGEVVKCEHERSVHLFVDSLVNQDKQSFAFQCTDSSRFKKGICLSCRKNRCNGIGYNARRIRHKRNSKMYLKTRADMPFKVYHYQMKIHVFSYKGLGEVDPTFSVTLHGTNGDSEPLSLEMLDLIGLNATNTFLVYTEEDMGELLKIKLTWEGTSQSWYDLWKELRSYWYRPMNSSQELHIRRIRVKSGETQQRFAFCVEDSQLTSISPGKELWFVKCTEEWQKRSVSNLL
ncbi:endothelial lipase isoform X1 [Parus major]|uniref:endothelial lipase isoform X1 n=1 Tax=Parus major TaxID=9157 RepID=UPI00077161F2|nr:endothelial lipase isoform X1 [Parus major]